MIPPKSIGQQKPDGEVIGRCPIADSYLLNGFAIPLDSAYLE
jgi:hypothetical protein